MPRPWAIALCVSIKFVGNGISYQSFIYIGAMQNPVISSWHTQQRLFDFNPFGVTKLYSVTFFLKIYRSLPAKLYAYIVSRGSYRIRDSIFTVVNHMHGPWNFGYIGNRCSVGIEQKQGQIVFLSCAANRKQQEEKKHFFPFIHKTLRIHLCKIHPYKQYTHH